jgi:GntP family gluconate:H+ symporter
MALSGVTTYFLTKKSGAATALAILAAAVAGCFAAGFGFPLRQLVEGSVAYMYFILVVFSSTLFMDIMKRSGAFSVVVRDLVRVSYKAPMALLVLLMFVVILPGAITGIGTVAVLATGAVVGAVLRGLGLPLQKAAAFVAMGGVFGLAAPPVNLYSMIIASANNVPYSGFFGPLALFVVPLAVFTALFFGAAHVKGKMLDLSALTANLPSVPQGMTRWRAYGPFSAVLLMLLGTYLFPFSVPVVGMPMIFLIGAALALLASTSKIQLLTVCSENIKMLFSLISVLTSVGVLVNAMALTGTKGLFILSTITLPRLLVYVGAALALPVSCSLFGFGAAGVLGTPIVLGFLGQNIVMTTAAVSTILPLGALIPPTALTGKFAAYTVEYHGDYMNVVRICFIPSLMLEIVCMLAIVYANPLGRLLA